MKIDVHKNFLKHPILGVMDAFYVEGGQSYLTTGKLAIGSLPFAAVIGIWTDPKCPSDIAISSAVNLVRSDDDFRAEVEHRLFDNYIGVTRQEYLDYARDPSYGITPAMLPEIHTPSEVWSIFRPKENDAVSVNGPNEFYPSEVAEVTLSFCAAFDAEHDFHIVFKDGKFFELTR